MNIKFKEWLHLTEVGESSAGGGVMGGTPFSLTPTSQAPKNFVTYSGNTGCGGGPGVKKGGTIICPDVNASGQSGGPAAKRGGAAAAAPVAAGAKTM